MNSLPLRREQSARRWTARFATLLVAVALAGPSLAVLGESMDEPRDLISRVASWWVAFWGADDAPKGPSTDPGGLVGGTPPRPTNTTTPLSAGEVGRSGGGSPGGRGGEGARISR